MENLENMENFLVNESSKTLIQSDKNRKQKRKTITYMNKH